MRTDASGEQCIAVHHQMLGRNSRGDTVPRTPYKLNRARRRDVFEHHAQLRVAGRVTGDEWTSAKPRRLHICSSFNATSLAEGRSRGS